PRSVPEPFFYQGYAVGWILITLQIIFGIVFLIGTYKQAIRSIVISKDAEQETRTNDDGEKNAPQMAEFYLKRRTSTYLGLKKNQKKIPYAAKSKESKKADKEKAKGKGKESKKKPYDKTEHSRTTRRNNEY
ncbi:hypothetical protein PENTCL1PPCAC_26742, partial [Pristionchus entomophagus]